MKIRTATRQDRDTIRNIYMSVFPEGESKIVSKLALDLLAEKTTPQTISLVAEIEAAVVGHGAFSPVIIGTSAHVQGYILAPLGVKSDYQRRRIGSQLIAGGRQQLSAMGIHVLFVYGDPRYYSRFGFNADTSRPFTAPFQLQFPFGWQAVMLNEYDMEGAAGSITCVASLSDPVLW